MWAEKGGVERAVGLGVERTSNMPLMIVMLDVSRLSGWLNAVADCRVQWEAYHEGDMEGQETGGRESGSPSNVQGGPDW